MEKGSGILFNAIPVTWPALLMACAKLARPPKVPRLRSVPLFQVTARISFTPSAGSTTPFSDAPAIRPLSLIQLARLQLLSSGESAPKSLIVSFRDTKAWEIFRETAYGWQ